MHQRAFSLVELSIVLVILGLLTGGILVGQSLIHAAELRKTLTSVNEYRTAIQSFRDKYFALPGDMANAKSFWTSCTDVAGELCNGNANGTIEQYSPTSVYLGENLRAWQHMVLAGLIPGSYTGIRTGGTAIQDFGVNLPRSSYTSSGFGLGANGYGPPGVHSIYISGQIGNNPYVAYVPVEDTWNMDTKTDDGRPLQGNTRADRGYTCSNFGCPSTCYTGAAGSEAYNLSVSNDYCRMAFGL